MISDKSKPNTAPTMKFAKDEAEAKAIVSHAKGMGLEAIMKLVSKDYDEKAFIASRKKSEKHNKKINNVFQNAIIDYGGGYRVASTPVGWIVFYSGIKVGHGNNEEEAKQVIRDDSKKRFFGHPHEPVANCAFQNGRTRALDHITNKAGLVGVKLENAGDAYEEGENAAQNNVSRNANKYPKGSGQWKQWDSGWSNATGNRLKKKVANMASKIGVRVENAAVLYKTESKSKKFIITVTNDKEGIIEVVSTRADGFYPTVEDRSKYTDDKSRQQVITMAKSFADSFARNN